MELMEAIRQRRSIRQYRDQPVNDQLVQELIAAACLSPSAKNRQPWKFMVLRGAEKDQVAQLMEAWCNAQGQDIPRYAKSSRYTAGSIRQAPVLILIFCAPDPIWDIGDALSIGAAAEHMCLRAEELGLGTLWILDTRYAAPEICRYVGAGALTLTCALAVGYADEAPPPKPRKSPEETILRFNGSV